MAPSLDTEEGIRHRIELYNSAARRIGQRLATGSASHDVERFSRLLNCANTHLQDLRARIALTAAVRESDGALVAREQTLPDRAPVAMTTVKHADYGLIEGSPESVVAILHTMEKLSVLRRAAAKHAEAEERSAKLLAVGTWGTLALSPTLSIASVVTALVGGASATVPAGVLAVAALLALGAFIRFASEGGVDFAELGAFLREAGDIVRGESEARSDD